MKNPLKYLRRLLCHHGTHQLAGTIWASDIGRLIKRERTGDGNIFTGGLPVYTATYECKRCGAHVARDGLYFPLERAT